MARAAAQSQEELFRLTRRTLEAVSAFSIPMVLAIALGAETWIDLVYGEAFLPAAAVLRLQAPILALTYVAMVCASVLTVQGKGWWVTRTSVVSMVLNSTLNLTLAPALPGVVRPGGRRARLGPRAVHLRGGGRVPADVGRGRARLRQAEPHAGWAKTLAVCAVVTGVHVALVGPGPPAAGLVGACLYLVLVFVTGAVRLDELQGLLRVVRQRRARVQPSAA